MRRYLIWCMSWLALCRPIAAQDLLSQQVSVSFSGHSVPQALASLSSITGLDFSYNPDLLPQNNIAASFQDAALSQVLAAILGDGFEYKSLRQHIIILPTKSAAHKKEPIQLSGSVTDAETGEELQDVSVYELNSLKASLTDLAGMYSLSAKAGPPTAVLMVSRVNYHDTVVVLDKDKMPSALHLRLRKQEEVVTSPSVDALNVAAVLGQKSHRHARNIPEMGHRLFQISFLPGLGTNGLVGGKVSNTLSLNLVGGYAYQLRGVEVGGAFNLLRMEMQGVQLAGALNIVGAEGTGVQLAGAGNVALSHWQGVQGAGAWNFAKETTGAQLAGAYNHTQKLTGVQASGALNIVRQMTGIQLAGAVNVATRMKGAQMSGVANRATAVRGIQAAGVLNQATVVHTGVQVSGLVNFTDTLRGFQVSVINFGGQVEGRGAMLGIVNLSKNGLVVAEVGSDDVTPFHVSFKSGTHRLYTILNAGIRPADDLWSYGMGVGTQFALSPKVSTGVELTSHVLNSSGTAQDYRVFVPFGYSFTRRIGLYGGPVAHFFVEDATDGSAIRQKIKPGTSGPNLFWLGYQVHLRL